MDESIVQALYVIAGIVAGGLISWLITHRYYLKSLGNQSAACVQQLTSISESLEASDQKEKANMRHSRIRDALKEYRRKGTPEALIDTFSDLSMPQKAELLDTVLLLARGRKAKNNKYKIEDAI